MMFVLEVLRHTPVWVWLVFAYLIWVGVRRSGEVELPLARVAVLPAVFIVMGVFGAVARRQPFALTAPPWLGGAVLGAVLGALTSPRHVAYDAARRRVKFCGGVFPLLRNLVIFCAQYVLAVAAAIGGAPRVAVWATAVSGLSAGYFIGWGVMFVLRLRRAPTASVARAAA